MDIEVTVFMPVYNCEKYLEESIKSILNQTFKNFELLIINDGSTDSSVDIINKFKDDRIRLISNDGNKGLPYTRNRGLQLSKGKYIALMDADDISKPDRLEKQVEFLKNNKKYDVVASNVDWINGNRIKKSKKFLFHNDNANIGLLFRNVIPNPSAMFSKEFVDKNNIKYREECFVGQDYAFWVDCQTKTKIKILKEPLLIYRYGHDNITKKSTKNRYFERKKVLDEIRTRALINNKIKLESSEYKLFNHIFSDPIAEFNLNDIRMLIKVLNKMIQINEEDNMFNKKEFSNIIKYEITNAIRNSNLKKIEKLKILTYKFKYESIVSYYKSLIIGIV